MKKAVIKIIVIIIFFGGAYQLINKKGSDSNKAEQAKPNFIVIMADDLGYGDVGFNGSTEIPTPNIDRIAANGIKFTNGYTSYSVCSPSRAGFITGRYQQRFGYERNIQYRPNDPNMGLPQTEKTIPEVLGQVGYKSRIIGKWHLGAHISNHPMNRGFTSFFGHLGGGHKYFPEELTIKDSYSFSDEPMSYKTWIMKDHTPVEIKNYLTDEFSDNAVSFIDKNQEDPFFLFVSYNAPHGPLQAT
ncbi:MAG: sulfatase-like hydrolase/transferase, partial [Flavobacteriales bacterium]